MIESDSKGKESLVQDSPSLGKDGRTVIRRPDPNTEFDIILPAHNNFELTVSCIKSLYGYARYPFHLIILDDSTDFTPVYLEHLTKETKNITYIHHDEPYKCGNQFFNEGLKHCRYEFVATVMNSVTVQPEWEIAPIEVLKANPKIATVGLKCLFPWGTIESAGIKITNRKDIGGVEIGGWFPTDIGVNLPGHLLTNCYEREAVQWALAMHRKEALIGNLDENTYHGFVGWDDIDNCFVLRKKGWKIYYCGTGCGYHRTRATRGVEPDDLEHIRKNKENGEIFRKRWNLNGDKPKSSPSEIGRIPANRAERRRLARV